MGEVAEIDIQHTTSQRKLLIQLFCVNSLSLLAYEFSLPEAFCSKKWLFTRSIERTTEV